MPLRSDLRHFYGREWRTITRPRILARAQNRCEACLKPNDQVVLTISGRNAAGEAFMLWRTGGPVASGLPWNNQTGWPARIGDYIAALAAPVMRRREVRVVLTVAHLNHTSGDDRDENLRAWCQWCHLHYDRQVNQLAARNTRAVGKDAARPLLQEAM
jgi:hypothetical protein